MNEVSKINITANHYLYLIVGEQRSGKTTWIIDNVVRKAFNKIPITIINPANELLWNEFSNSKLLLNIDQNNVNSDLPTIKQRYATRINLLIKTFQGKRINNVIILDDSRPLVSDNFPESLFSLLSFRRQMSSNMFFVFHSLRSVPSQFWTYADYLILFRTRENPQFYQNKLPLPLLDKIQEFNIDKLTNPVIIKN